MALIQLCKLKSMVNVHPSQQDEKLAEPRSHLDMNFVNNLQLALPPIGNPVDFMKQFSYTQSGKPIKLEPQHSTTALGFVYKGGVILAVDSGTTNSRAYTLDTTSSESILVVHAGLAADGVYWFRHLRKTCRLYELRNKERISIAAASKIMANMTISLKGMGLSVGMLLGGYDKKALSDTSGGSTSDPFGIAF